MGPPAYRVHVALSDAERLYVAIGQVVRSGAEVEYALQILVEKMLGHYGPLIARGHRFELLYALAVQIARTERADGRVMLGPLETMRADIDLRDKLVHGMAWESYGAPERVLLRTRKSGPPGPAAMTVEQLENLDTRLHGHYADLMAYAAWLRDPDSS